MRWVEPTVMSGLVCFLWSTGGPILPVLSNAAVVAPSQPAPEKERKESPKSEPRFRKAPPVGLGQRLKSRSYNLISFGENVSVAKGEVVHGDAIVLRGDLLVEGLVEGDAITIDGDLDLRATAQITGQAVALGGEIAAHPRALVEGKAISLSFPLSFAPNSVHPSNSLAFLLDVLKLGFLLLVAGLLLAAVPRRLARATSYLNGTFLRCFGVGLLSLLGGWFTVAVCIMLLMITIIGIPLALFVILAAAVLQIISLFVGIFLLGERAGRFLHLDKRGPGVLVGLVLLLLPELLSDGLQFLGLRSPDDFLFESISLVLVLVISASGLGSLLLTRFGAAPMGPMAGR